MWITVHSEKSFCPFLGRDITISNNNVSTCCIPSAYKLAITYYFFDEDNEDNIVNTLLKQYQFYRTESFNGRVPLFCIDCPILSDDQSVWGNTIDNLNFNVHTYCNADCVYCNAEGILKIRNEKTLINYEERCKIISKILLEVKSNKTFNEKSRLTLVGGEITVNANKKLLYDMVNHIPHNPILIYTNGFIYDEEIANILTTNSNAQIMCNIDAGTRITYIKVKGFDKFNIVRNNLKKYVNSGTVILKYIIKPGWNDTNEDILGTIDLLKFLNIDVLLISPDFKYVSLNKKEIKREIVFSASKFKIMLEKSNFKCVVLDVYWQRQYITEINRTVNELKSADFTL